MPPRVQHIRARHAVRAAYPTEACAAGPGVGCREGVAAAAACHQAVHQAASTLMCMCGRDLQHHVHVRQGPDGGIPEVLYGPLRMLIWFRALPPPTAGVKPLDP